MRRTASNRGRRCRRPRRYGFFPDRFSAKRISPQRFPIHGAAMMILRSSPPSPFGRKVRIAISLLGFDGDVKIEPADTTDVNDSVRRQNPLGKIPVLIAEDGTAYYDSRVILDYLDDRAGGGKIVPRDAEARLAALRLQALCDGILDASILTIYEARWRKAETHEPKWLEHQAGKVARGLAALEAAPPALDAGACRMSARSRSPARSAIAICASAAAGAAIIRGSSPGSTISPRGCRPTPRPRRPVIGLKSVPARETAHRRVLSAMPLFSLDELSAAAASIRGVVPPTPALCLAAARHSDRRRGRSSSTRTTRRPALSRRAAAWSMSMRSLRAGPKPKGLVTATRGNHGQSVAAAADAQRHSGGDRRAGGQFEREERRDGGVRRRARHRRQGFRREPGRRRGDPARARLSLRAVLPPRPRQRRGDLCA